jgi:tetratricopeptide (TPR) repeat protein
MKNGRKSQHQKPVPQAAHERLASANALLKQGRPAEAKVGLRELVRKFPSLAEAWVGLAHIARAEHDRAGALSCFGKAAKLRPGDPNLLMAYAEELAELDQTGRAVAIYDKLIAAHPKAIKPRADKARLLQLTGDFAAAEQEFHAALALAPEDGQLYRIFLATKKVTADDPLVTRMERLWDKADLSLKSRVQLGFALAKAMEDSGQTDRVFTYLRPANEGMRKLHPYDVGQREQEIENLIALFGAYDFSALKPEGPGAFNPIFVTGLPRSGTTLIEQIISSHPEVTGAGELPLFGRSAMRLLTGEAGGHVPVDRIEPRSWQALGREYERAVRKIVGDARGVTDKAIQTYMVLGPLRLALPTARAILVWRDPRDTLLSIYKNVFAEGRHLYAYDLGDLARYYLTFERMVEFWRDAMPDGFVETSYEDVVTDRDTQSRRLIDAAGLDWDDSCGDLSGNDRMVKTLSVHQVRQPLYTSSIGAWKRYESELAEMLEVLERGR